MMSSSVARSASITNPSLSRFLLTSIVTLSVTPSVISAGSSDLSHLRELIPYEALAHGSRGPGMDTDRSIPHSQQDT